MAERNDLIKSVCVDAEALLRIQIRSKGRLVSSNRCPMTRPFFFGWPIVTSPHRSFKLMIYSRICVSADEVRNEMNGHTDEEIKRQRLHYSSDQLYSVS